VDVGVQPIDEATSFVGLPAEFVLHLQALKWAVVKFAGLKPV
jgi:hypothetical protein